MNEPSDIEAEIRRQTVAAGAQASISPGDVAHALSPPPPSEAWRGKLSAVRRAAIRLALAGEIDILRKGKPVEPATAKGVIRLRLRPPASAA